MSRIRTHPNGVPLLSLVPGPPPGPPDPDIAVVLRTLPGQTVPFDARLRRLLKAARRAYGFAVVGCTDIPPRAS
jgi:hypothetical protein